MKTRDDDIQRSEMRDNPSTKGDQETQYQRLLNTYGLCIPNMKHSMTPNEDTWWWFNQFCY